jgi:hypothetical protein
MRKNMYPMTFGDWLISLNMMFSGSIHLPESDIISFFFMAEYYYFEYIYHIFFIHSLVVGHLDYFQSLALVSRSASVCK